VYCRTDFSKNFEFCFVPHRGHSSPFLSLEVLTQKAWWSEMKVLGLYWKATSCIVLVYMLIEGLLFSFKVHAGIVVHSSGVFLELLPMGQSLCWSITAHVFYHVMSIFRSKKSVFLDRWVLFTCYPVESGRGASSEKNTHQFFLQKTPTCAIWSKAEEEPSWCTIFVQVVKVYHKCTYLFDQIKFVYHIRRFYIHILNYWFWGWNEFLSLELIETRFNS